MTMLATTKVSTPSRRRRPAPALRIRPARPADMRTVADMISSSADWYREFVEEGDMAEHDVDLEWARRNFARRDFFVGEAEGEAVGTISLQTLGAWTYLGYVYLDVEHVGKGFGGQLLRFAERRTREMGTKGMCLIAHPEAEWATKAYRKFGFRRIASTREEVLAWQDGVLKPYYEEGFELYAKPAEADAPSGG